METTRHRQWGREELKQGWKKLQVSIRWLYLFTMGVLVLWYLYAIFTYRKRFVTPDWVQVLRCLTVVLAIWQGKLWKEKGFWFLGAFFLLVLIRLFFPSTEGFTNRKVRESLFLGLWLFTGCYGLGRTVNGKELRIFLRICLAVWTVGMVAYSIVGIYAAWTGETVRTIGGTGYWARVYKEWNPEETVGLSYGLIPVYGENTAASLLSLSALLACCMAFCATSIVGRVLFTAGVLPILSALGLTGARTGRIVFALGFGGMIGLLAFRYLYTKKRRKAIVSCFAGVLSAALAAGMAFWLVGMLTEGISVLMAKGSILVNTAKAEDAASHTVVFSNRGLGGLSGREEIWGTVLQFIIRTPRVLWGGESLYHTMNTINQYPDRQYAHTHNTLLQVWLESGIFGLLLVISFVIVIAVRGVRLIREHLSGDREVPRWIYLLPAIILAVWAGEMVECFIVLFRIDTPTQALLFICMGIVSAYGEKKKRVPEGNSAAPAPVT